MIDPRPPELEALAHLLSRRSRRVMNPSPGARDAAVLAPLCWDKDQRLLSVLFTLRTEDVPTHKGQVAFPGGAREAEDADLVATALRETWEELGIAPEHVDVLGLGDDAFSITGMRVTPVVGWVGSLPPLAPNAREIADVFTVPLYVLRDPASVGEQEWRGPDGRLRRIPFFNGGRHPIWGLTAWMLRDVLYVMDGLEPVGVPG